MKKIICLGVLALLSTLTTGNASPARAQDAVTAPVSVEKQKPNPTTPDYIAMLFYKLSGRPPDFKPWARRTPEYKSASSFDKVAVQDQQVQVFKNIYDLLTIQEPVIVEVPVKLSAYSNAHKGFFVENFQEDTFFPFRFNDQSYAVIPIGIMDQQWLKIEDPALAGQITAAAQNSQNQPLTMVVVLIPKYADAALPAIVNEEKYWIMSAEVKNMTLYAPGSATPLWESSRNDPEDLKRQELLKLRQ